jgi:hypothetical protein
MKSIHDIRRWLALTLAASVLAGPTLAATAKDEAARPAAQTQTQAQGQAQDKAAEERAKIIEEAVTALARTNTALRALDAGDTEKALEDLAVAVGKLELIVAAHPELALAPVDVQVITQDLVATPADVEKAVKKAEDLLDDGRVQDARAILKDLGSEVIVRVVSIPLATYPDAIKAVAPLIQAGKLEEAKQALVAALGTLVIVDNVIPLPLLRAERALEEAKALAAREDRSKEESERLAALLRTAREQIALADALGYADEDALEPLQKNIAELEKRTAGGESGTDLFDKLRKGFEELRAKL